MLELGCGTGHWTEYFLQKGFEVIAIDKLGNDVSYSKKEEIKSYIYSR